MGLSLRWIEAVLDKWGQATGSPPTEPVHWAERRGRGPSSLAGSEPPYHAPVFVLTHYAHDPIEMDGGSTFHFVTDGFDSAYSAACTAAGDNGVDIAGGASTVRQALGSDVIEELTLDIAPALLGSGEGIFDGLERFPFEPVEVLHSPLTTHIRYRRIS